MRIPRWLPYLLGFLAAAGPMSTDFYLPSFNMIERDFGTPHGSAQITLSAWFLGYACGQMIQGAATDWLGRRRPLIVGTSIYALASLGCALAPGMAVLSCWRFIAALGGAASSVIPRAVVRDHADGHEAAAILAQLTLVMGAAPILAPTVGGMLLKFMSWRGLFFICTFYGLIGLLLVLMLLPETLPVQARHRVDVWAAARRYGRILAAPKFNANALVGSASMFTIFGFVAGSPALVTAYHISAAHLGLLLMLAALPYITAAQINPRALMRFGADAVLRTAIAGSAVATIALFSLAHLFHPALPLVMACVMLNTGCLGFVNPNAAISAMSGFPESAGSASALYGTCQFLSAALCGLIGGALANGTLGPVSDMMITGSAAMLAAQTLRVRRLSYT